MLSILDIFNNGNSDDIMSYVNEIIYCIENNIHDKIMLYKTADLLVRFDHLEILKYLYNIVIPIKGTNETVYLKIMSEHDNFNLFNLACQLGRLNIVKHFSQYMYGSDLKSAIYVSTAHYDVFIYLLSLDICIDRCDQLFLIACRDGCIDVIKYLLDNYNYDIHARDNMAFHYAYIKRRVDVLKILLNVVQDYSCINDELMNNIYMLINEKRCRLIKNAYNSKYLE